jgi:exonuclease SbcD
MAATSGEADFCFVHAADLHLDTPFKGISETAPHVGAALREASLRALDNLVRVCVEAGAAFLLLAGDLYDGPERGLRAQFRLRDGLQSLSEAGIRVFIVHGNHDPVTEGWSAIGAWPPLVHVFGHDAVTSVTVERHGVPLATVQGVSYAKREVTDNLALDYSRTGAGGLEIGLLHCNVAGAPDGHAAYSPCTLGDLRAAGLDYWALGHIHARTVMSGVPFGDEPFVVYPGNLQARSPKPSEQGPKGATVVHVRSGRVSELEAVPCDVVRFEQLDVEIDGCESVSDLRACLSGVAVRAMANADGRSLVLRARLTGRSTVHAELARPGVLDALLAHLREECTSDEPFIWWDRLVDGSESPLDLEQLRQAGDFVADLLELSASLGGAAERPLPLSPSSVLGDELVHELLGKVPLDLRKRALSLLDNEMELGELMEASSRLALDVLEVGR